MIQIRKYLEHLTARGNRKDLGQPRVRLLNPHQQWLMVFQLGNRSSGLQQIHNPSFMKPKNGRKLIYTKSSVYSHVYMNKAILWVHFNQSNKPNEETLWALSCMVLDSKQEYYLIQNMSKSILKLFCLVKGNVKKISCYICYSSSSDQPFILFMWCTKAALAFESFLKLSN